MNDKEKLEAISKEISLVDFGYEKYCSRAEIDEMKTEWKVLTRIHKILED